MAFQAETYDLTSRFHLVETWERLRRAFHNNPTNVYRIEADGHSAAVSLLSHLNRVRAAYRVQKEDGHVFDSIAATIKRVAGTATSGRAQQWVLEFRDRGNSAAPIIRDTRGRVVS